MKSIFKASILLIAFHSPAFADSACILQPNQEAINACAQGEYQDANNSLEIAYSHLSGRLSAEGAAQLEKANDSWHSYKDEWCQFQSGMANSESKYPTAYWECLTKLTNDQITFLRHQLTCDEGSDCAPQQ